LIDAVSEMQLLGVGVAGAEQQVAGGLLGDVDDQVDLVGRAGHLAVSTSTS
jgi:hypothetical protein